MGTKSLNSSGAGGDACISLICLDSNAVTGTPVDLVNGANTITLDDSSGQTGNQPNTNGTYGWAIKLAKNGSFNEYGLTLGAPVAWNVLTFGATGWSIFIAANGIDSPGANSTVYTMTQSTTVAGSGVPQIGFNGTVGAYIPQLRNSSASEVVGTSIGASTAFSAAATGSYGTSKTWTLYQDGASAGSTTLSNSGGDNSIARIGGLNGQGSMNWYVVYLALFNRVLTSAEISTLHASLTGGGAFDLVTISGGGGGGPILLLDSAIDGGMSTMEGGMTCRPRTSPRIFLPPRNVLTPAHL